VLMNSLMKSKMEDTVWK